MYGSPVLTVRARSAPIIPGLASTRSSSRAGSDSVLLIAARIVPRSRSRRVSARVPRTAIPVIP